MRSWYSASNSVLRVSKFRKALGLSLHTLTSEEASFISTLFRHKVPRPFSMSLRAILVLTAMLAMVPGLVLLAQALRTAYDVGVAQITADHVHVAEIASGVLDDHFDEALAVDYSYATDPVILSFDPRRIDEHLSRLAPLFPEYENVVAIFDARGDLVGSAIRAAPENVADAAWFQEVMRTGRPIVDGVTMSRASGKPMVRTGVPILDRSGKPMGVASSVLSVDRLVAVLSVVQEALGQQTFLADPQGLLAFHSGKPVLPWEQRDVSWFDPVRVAREGREFVGETVDSLMGDERIIVSMPTRKYGWIVGVSMPVSAALAPARDHLRDMLAIFASAIVFSLGLAFIVGEVLLRPLRRLDEHAEALIRGQLHQRVEVTTTCRELDDLARDLNDMTRKMKTREEQREDYIHSISHDLRAPLTIIQGHAQMIQRGGDRTDMVLSSAVAITSSARRMSLMIQDLADSARLEAGQMRLETRPVDLDRMVSDLLTQLTGAMDVGRIKVNIPTRLPYVNADPNRLERILINLITNALKYSRPGTDVSILAKPVDGEVVTSVTDQGQGIAPEDLPHIFERFYRAKGTRRGDGLGLGLYITKGLVEAHGGRIWVESELGKGSTFHFSLSAICRE